MYFFSIILNTKYLCKQENALFSFFIEQHRVIPLTQTSDTININVIPY